MMLVAISLPHLFSKFCDFNLYAYNQMVVYVIHGDLTREPPV